MAQQKDDWSKKWASIVAQAWADDNFKKRLQVDPAKVLAEQGLKVAPGVRIKIVEDTDQVVHLALPQKPSSEELADEHLKQIAGGIHSLKIGYEE